MVKFASAYIRDGEMDALPLHSDLNLPAGCKEKAQRLLGFLLFLTCPQDCSRTFHHFGEFHHFGPKFVLNRETALERDFVFQRCVFVEGRR
jgi:hypothetical protein